MVLFCLELIFGLLLLDHWGSIFSQWQTCRKLETEGVPVELVQLLLDVMF